MTSRLAVQQLEPRDTPAASQFTDIMPGVWGSYPQNLTPSGNTLFFSADNGHGYELYATDGTTTKMVKDIRPGLGGSNPTDFFAAGNGVVFFTADDGGGRRSWRSDGTAAGTYKFTPPSPGWLANGGADTIGWKGELYYLQRTPATGALSWWRTSGQTETFLKDFGTTLAAYPPRTPAMQIDGDRLTLTWQTTDGNTVVWQTDGTPAGTKLQQQHLTANGLKLDPGAEISPGRFVFATTPASVHTASVWVGDGTTAGRQLLRAFDATPYTLFAVNTLAVGGKAYFTVASNSYPQPADVGQWVTDGTPAGTRKLDLGLGDGWMPRVMFAFGDKLLISAIKNGQPEKFYLSDGTAVGTTPIVPPIDGDSNFWNYAMYTPPDAQNPKGLLLFQESVNGKVFRTDGVTAAVVDITSLATPPGRLPIQGSGNGRATLPAAVGPGAYYRGAIYYPGKTDVQRPELWKWDVNAAMPTTPTPAAGPAVTGVVVNDGAAQRSMVTKLTVSFDQVVSLGIGGITAVDAAGATVPTAVSAVVVGGKTVATVTFTGPTAVGGSVADGAYTLKVNAAKVWSLSGTAMGADATASFTRLFGDLDGDRAYNREARWMLHEKVGATAGTPAYDARFDFNSDGVIDAADEVQVVRRWLKTV